MIDLQNQTSSRIFVTTVCLILSSILLIVGLSQFEKSRRFAEIKAESYLKINDYFKGFSSMVTEIEALSLEPLNTFPRELLTAQDSIRELLPYYENFRIFQQAIKSQWAFYTKNFFLSGGLILKDGETVFESGFINTDNIPSFSVAHTSNIAPDTHWTFHGNNQTLYYVYSTTTLNNSVVQYITGIDTSLLANHIQDALEVEQAIQLYFQPLIDQRASAASYIPIESRATENLTLDISVGMGHFSPLVWLSFALALVVSATILSIWTFWVFIHRQKKLTQYFDDMQHNKKHDIRPSVFNDEPVNQLIEQIDAINKSAAKLSDKDLINDPRVLKKIQSLLSERESTIKTPSLKSEFLSRMGDEITAPMETIAAMLAVLDEHELQKEHKQLLAVVSRSWRILQLNLTNILDSSKLDANMLLLSPTKFNARLVVQDISQRYMKIAQQKSLQFDWQVDGSVPSTAFNDETRLRQVLQNLLDNAFKFTKRGKVHLQVEYVRNAQKDWLKFIVADTGVGIPKEAQLDLFDSLEQETKLTGSSFSGRLRLIVAKQLVELMGGKIGVSSEPGKGSRFGFTIDKHLGLSTRESSPIENNSDQQLVNPANS
ncbi:MAG: ATP-binding protein [Pseudomonadota bacterium]